ncbi:Muniscin C-terminal mu homology domain-containing protein [Podospora aff. communis PSN243]|uniref:Muniscin C-terminal mu homology domain-containing protein n=1 Tax=Podospora aff. communis PSN243 TaxID=3040156 RepID=A0AAV9GKL7_9PEZI|nr:Muniscin C-terminal mu homology domain-containing protein [Podospora aff. communis PSN243]
MEDLSRAEYPAMLANLQPSQAVQTLSDRVKRISKVNQEIADWLQERRRVEEQYVAGLRKLLVFKVPNTASELGVFTSPWEKILQSTDAIAASHQLFAQRIDKDVEASLRGFHSKKEMQNLQTISANLLTMAKELDDAAEKSEKLTRKGGKANSHKVDLAASRLESATQQWESQAPFIFETLQAVDEQRINHLRDVLTQFETHEVDQATRTQATAEEVLNVILEVNTEQEIQNFVQRTVSGKPKVERKPITRQSSIVAGSNLAPPSVTGHEDDVSDHSGHREGQPESRLRSRIGTMLGRRRQSIHGGFNPLSPPKLGSFSRNIGSSHGQTLSPRASSHNLTDSQNRLSSLVESPTTAGPNAKEEPKLSHEGTNGVSSAEPSQSAGPTQQSSSILNGTAEDIFDAPPPPGPPPSQQKAEEPAKDAEGFTIPVATNDPIAQAQKEAAAEEADQFFKLNIQKEPIAEEDQDAKQAALSNVANALTTMAIPSRKSGTIRGRRDVRNTVYMPSSLPVPENSTENPFPPSPSLPPTSSFPKPTPSSTFASEPSHASDTQSIRSGTSVGGASAYSSITRLRHPDLHGPGYGPGLHSSIIETVSATFENGAVKSAKMSGEIALSYVPNPDSLSGSETIRLNNFPHLDSIGPNRVFVNNTSSPDEFTIDTSHLSVTAPAFTYRVHAEDDATLAAHCPILLQPAWKPQGDKLGLLLQYKLNPDSVLPRPVTLSNVAFIATYEGARASGVQTKPPGTHLKEKHIVYWRLGDVTLTDDWSKIICRVIGEQNAEPQPGHIEVRWDYAVTTSPESAETSILGSGISVSRLVEGKGKEKAKEEGSEEEEEDPFADDKGPLSPATIKDSRTWVEVPLVRRLVSGKYKAK